MSTPIRILIVADDPVLRAGFRCLLAREPSLVIGGEAADGAAAVTQANTLTPDVILLDLVLPSQSGLATIAALQQHIPAVRILVLTDLANADVALQALRRAGATGCLLKTTPIPALSRAIHTVAAGDIVVQPSLATEFIRTLTTPRTTRALSEREHEILQLVARGLSAKAIAETLFIDKNTVNTYLYRMYRKLRVVNRDQAVRYALATGLANLEQTYASLNALDSYALCLPTLETHRHVEANPSLDCRG